ncbi:MAG: hypothetical protein KDD69_14115 [Bdellovibrionales bacterium]|nr:hypothetical protein [Bdellovibrionales bacterium]
MEEALKDATLVFVGRVEDQKESAFKKDQMEVKFTVFKRFKGFEEVPNNEYVLIHTPKDSAGCGYNFTNGFEYLVFATGTPAHFRTNLCSRTEVLENAQLDQHRLLRLTGQPEEPESEPSPLD